MINYGRDDAREFRNASNKSSVSIEYILDGGESELREANKKRVAKVISRTNKGMGYFIRGGCGHRFTNGSEAPELIVRGTREISDMFRESK